ncbi:diaminopimelate decarboxylase [Virgisporangium aliadipatigenens]|uniref:Diaminopimelate decarboxylase n=1 Tax=Virgisporangium aliadipatigenens TaxID=741659 RepID=A0A8J3YJP8_9ACTN|nr:type III PLP-dependent enzyme [Virgisporangium aliadipatigenens]GIJ45632.1 diaminopimelate decarboxylase [Virgisporangium aliadipatigenens]
MLIPPHVADAVRALPRPVCGYVYDAAVARERATAVRAALPTGAGLYYAVKANGDPRMLAALAGVVDGFEVASGGELALAAGHPVLFGGPAKTDDELRAALAADATIHVEGILELRRLAALAEDPGAVRLALRVNRPGPPLPGSHAMAGTATPFGIAEDALPEAARTAHHLGLRPRGFHLHAVSNNLDATAHAAFVTDALQWSTQRADACGIDLAYVNVGGGLGVDHTGERAFDLDAFAAGIPDDPRLVLEPGRYLATAAGWYAAEVLDLKRTHGRWFAVLRGGTHHFRLPAAWGYSHPFTVLPVEEWTYPFDRPTLRSSTVDAVGELCTPRDVLARDRHVERLRVGDVLVFANTGGYGWDISHHDFLRHPHPQVRWLDGA